jgi:ribosomal protein S27E
LFKPKEEPVDPSKIEVQKRCWDCRHYPKGGRDRGTCKLQNKMVSGMGSCENFALPPTFKEDLQAPMTLRQRSYTEAMVKKVPVSFEIECPKCGEVISNPENGSLFWETGEIDMYIRKYGNKIRCNSCGKESTIKG